MAELSKQNQTNCADNVLMHDFNLPSPMHPIVWPSSLNHLRDIQKANNISVYCKRDDLIHPIVSGNKWRKLKSSVAHMVENKIEHVLSFGGAYSNHLHALAYICKQYDIKLSAFVRGQYQEQLTPMLNDITNWRADIHFLNKLDYKQRDNHEFCESLMAKTGAQWLIPEGGSNALSVDSMAELYDECLQQLPTLSHIVLPVASGGTIAGLIKANHLLFTNTQSQKINLQGIAVLQGENYLEQLVNNLLIQHDIRDASNWQIAHDFHHGGYAKSSPELAKFISEFNQTTNDNTPPIETVYSAKVFYALATMLEQNKFPPSSQIVILHTGGLQGAR